MCLASIKASFKLVYLRNKRTNTREINFVRCNKADFYNAISVIISCFLHFWQKRENLDTFLKPNFREQVTIHFQI